MSRNKKFLMVGAAAVGGYLVQKYGFPKDKLLFAGLVNGKNIWKNHYARTLEVLDELKKKGINTVLSHRQRM